VLDEVGEDVGDLGMPDRGQLKVLARRRRAGQDKDAGADDGANAQRRQAPRAERLLEPVFRLLGIRDQLVDGLGGE
jgi:hypothetical protein